MTKDDLIKGRMYCYWSKGISESKPSLKFCRLITFAKEFAIVKRLDLSVNREQRVEIRRLKEVRKIVKPIQERLPL